MIFPKYKIEKKKNVEWVASVSYGFLLRKTERVGIGYSMSSAVGLCETHHTLHHPWKTFKIRILG